MKDDIIFVKTRFGKDGSADTMLNFWKKNYSDRPAYVLGFENGKAVLYKIN